MRKDYYDVACDDMLFMKDIWHLKHDNRIAINAQQIAEKVLKSIAERVCISNPRILNSHNLRSIYQEIKRAGVILSLDIKELAFLTDFYFVRYPGEDYVEVDEEISDACVVVMKHVIQAVNGYRRQHNLYICEELSEKNK